MASLEDFEALLTKAGQGDRAAFFTLYDVTAPKLYGMCLAILDDEGWADEVLEIAYVRMWNDAIRSKATGLTPLTWVISIARETAVEARRAASSGDTPDPVELQHIAPSKSLAEAGDGPVPLLRRALGWLPQDRRDALLLSYFSGIRYKELATRYRVPYATIRNWHRRSLTRLYSDLTGKPASEDVLMAGEYVLDVIPVAEQKPFEARLQREKELQSLVSGWTEDFITLTDSLTLKTPRADLPSRLDATLFPYQKGSVLERLSVVQTLIWVTAAVSVGYLGYIYWPGSINFAPQKNQTPQQAIAPLDAPAIGLVLPEVGEPMAQFDPISGAILFGGDLTALGSATNQSVYLDFGDNTEWIALGSWPAIRPHSLAVASELHPIVRGAQAVVLGGDGSDQELLRLTVQ